MPADELATRRAALLRRQPRGRSGWLVGRRSSVSSSSARMASSQWAKPSARAIESIACNVGLAVPASISRNRRSLIPAAWARSSWLRCRSRRRRPTARPMAGWGLELRGTPEDSASHAQNARNYSSGMSGFGVYRPYAVPHTRFQLALPRLEGGYSMSRRRSAGVVPSARARRRSTVVLGSRRAFSSLLMCERSTPLRRARTTCEMPAASRDARRLAAS